jgi:hypothetical protein
MPLKAPPTPSASESFEIWKKCVSASSIFRKFGAVLYLSLILPMSADRPIQPKDGPISAVTPRASERPHRSKMTRGTSADIGAVLDLGASMSPKVETSAQFRKSPTVAHDGEMIVVSLELRELIARIVPSMLPPVEMIGERINPLQQLSLTSNDKVP